MSAHTPGPWQVATLDATKDPVEAHRKMLEFGSGPVFLVHAPNHPDATEDFAILTATVGNGPTSKANARLIAAAPELLEALKGLMNPPLDHTYCFSESCGRCQECAARAAIAKATGES